MQAPANTSTGRVVLGTCFAAIALAVAALLLIPPATRSLFSSNFLPHSYCYLFDKKLIALHAGSDAIIWLSYVSISCTLVYLVWRTRREIPFSWMFLAFGVFIVACGFTHFMEIVVLWKPLYWLAGGIKLLTALASVITAIALPALIPQVHRMVMSAHISEDRQLKLERANDELVQLSKRIMNVQDGERRRLARELHDGVGQYLAAIKMSCELAQQSPAKDQAAPLKDSLALIDRCTAEVRTLSHLLHPPLLEEMGLASAIPWYLEGFTKRSGIQVDLDMPPQVERFPKDVELALFRVLQEGLTNIHRHSGSKQAHVRFEMRAEQAHLTIQDRGRGLSLENGHAAKDGVGISSMRERVRELGGHFYLTSNPSGTTIEAVLPLHQKEATWHTVSSS